MWNKIQRIYVGTNLVRPPYGGGSWKPTANTILYMPLKIDLLDYWPGHISMTSSWTITIDGQWANFGNLSALKGQSSSTISWNFTFSSWLKLTSAGSGASIISIWQGYPGRGYRYGANSSWKIWFTLYSVYDWNYGTNFSTLYSNWHNLILTRSGTTNTLYLDWVSKGTYTWTSTPSSNNITIWGDYTSWTIQGNVNEIIIDGSAWTATEITNYYNNTKGIYWIS